MHFETYGPFEFDRNTLQLRKCDLWKAVEQRQDGLASAIGCYAFCLTYGSKTLPWYVGKTIAQAGFQGEVLQKHKLDHYISVLTENPVTALQSYFFQ